MRRACTGLVKVEMGYGFSAPPSGGPGAAEGGQAAAGGGRRQQALGPGVDSLNVSVATGILLHTLVSSAREQGAAGKA